jgi:hypothetical protein
MHSAAAESRTMMLTWRFGMWTDLWLRCEGGRQNKFTTSSSSMRMRRLVLTKAYFAGVFAKNFFCPQIAPPLLSCPKALLIPQGLLSLQRFWSRPLRFGCCLHVRSWAGLLLFSAMLCCVRLAAAQTFSGDSLPKTDGAGETAIEARIQILTRPIGALVFLEGEYSMVGRTPCTITHFLHGTYHIRATKPGYENWSTHYAFNGQGEDKLTIKLKPKTRLKAVMRSALVPGWGQVYADQRYKGFLISLLQFSAAGFLIYEDFRYTESLDDYRAALQDLRALQNQQDAQGDLVARVRAAKADLDDTYTRRRRWLIVAGSIYLYNLLDTALFFPSYQRGDLGISLTLDPRPGASDAAIGLNVNRKF